MTQHPTPEQVADSTEEVIRHAKKAAVTLYSKGFSFMCNLLFKKVDKNKDGRIDFNEVEIAVFSLYNKMKKTMPDWNEQPPVREKIWAIFCTVDTNKNGTLDPAEFELLAKVVMKQGPDVFFNKVSSKTVTESALVVAFTLALTPIMVYFKVPYAAPALAMVLAMFVLTTFRLLNKLLPDV